jgi:hypothetical protein
VEPVGRADGFYRRLDQIKRTYPLWDTDQKNWGWG